MCIIWYIPQWIRKDRRLRFNDGVVHFAVPWISAFALLIVYFTHVVRRNKTRVVLVGVKAWQKSETSKKQTDSHTVSVSSWFLP